MPMSHKQAESLVRKVRAQIRQEANARITAIRAESARAQGLVAVLDEDNDSTITIGGIHCFNEMATYQSDSQIINNLVEKAQQKAATRALTPATST